jgi:hypothetical protein
MSTTAAITPSISLRKKSSGGALSFADFLATLRVKARSGGRGDLIALYRTLINADTFPPIASWADLYHLMSALRAPDETVNEARKLWREYSKSQSAAVPGKTPEGRP